VRITSIYLCDVYAFCFVGNITKITFVCVLNVKLGHATQLAIKAADSGIRAQDIALLVGPEARQQV